MHKLYDTDVHALRDHIIVEDMNFGERVSRGGIIKIHDDGVESGIHPRWGKVYSVGPEQSDVKIGEWVLVKHGRWTRGVEVVKNGAKKTLRRIDTNDILVVSNRPSEEDY